MKMNTYIVALIGLLAVSVNVSAVERDTLIKGDPLIHGGFGGFSAKIGDINGRTETMVGGKGAWLVNHRAYLGMAGYGTKNTVNHTDQHMGYGGLIAGYIFNSHRMLHYNIEMLVGGGALAKRRHKEHDSYDHDNDDAFAVMEPAVNVSLAITKFSDISLGMSYRYIQETNQTNLSDSDLSGWSVNTSIVFGKF